MSKRLGKTKMMKVLQKCVPHDISFKLKDYRYEKCSRPLHAEAIAYRDGMVDYVFCFYYLRNDARYYVLNAGQSIPVHGYYEKVDISFLNEDKKSVTGEEMEKKVIEK